MQSNVKYGLSDTESLYAMTIDSAPHIRAAEAFQFVIYKPAEWFEVTFSPGQCGHHTSDSWQQQPLHPIPRQGTMLWYRLRPK